MANESQVKGPGEMVRELLNERGWTYEDLAIVTGRSAKTIGEIVRGRSGITAEMAACLAAAFGNSPDDWLRADAAYRLSLISPDTADIERRARVFSRAPILEMQRRGWIRATNDIDELDAELAVFFGQVDGTQLTVAARRPGTIPNLTPAEAAWCFRAKQLAGTLLCSPFSPKRLSRAKSELRRLAVHPREARHVSGVMAEFGVRFVVVEPLAGVRIDGASFWDQSGPSIAVSLRHDRVDGFWFTVMHEFSHVFHGDPISVDRGMVDAVMGVTVALADDETEDRANKEAADSLISAREIDSFINRVGPLYPRSRVIQFANRIRIHPGIIVGQLQHRKEIGYSAMRDQLVKIRDIVISTALTDGWGQAISPSVVRRPKLDGYCFPPPQV